MNPFFVTVDQLHSHVLALHDFTPIAPNATCLSFSAGQIILVRFVYSGIEVPTEALKRSLIGTRLAGGMVSLTAGAVGFQAIM